MARIPEAEVERLKREVSVERLAEARDIKLHRHGADLLGLCPFHADHSPSLVITPSKNLWHCLGACNMGGTAIDWVMKANGISFRHAVELLRADYLPLAAVPVHPVKQSTVPKLPPPVARNADDRALLVQIVDYYSRTLKQSPEALKYLASRGLQSSEIIDRFKLGFANRTLCYGLEGKNRVAGAELRGRLQKLGILRGERPRALQRLGCRAGVQCIRRGGRDVRAEDHGEAARGNAAALVSSRRASGRVE